MASTAPKMKIIAENRRARFDYFLEDFIEAGIMLLGTEIKALRDGRANIAESYAAVEGREIVLVNADIPPYKQANRFNHEPRRHRKLLLHRKQIDHIAEQLATKGMTLVPDELHFRRGFARIVICLASGKDRGDKRQDLIKRAMKRDVEREVARRVKHG